MAMDLQLTHKPASLRTVTSLCLTPIPVSKKCLKGAACMLLKPPTGLNGIVAVVVVVVVFATAPPNDSEEIVQDIVRHGTK